MQRLASPLSIAACILCPVNVTGRLYTFRSELSCMQALSSLLSPAFAGLLVCNPFCIYAMMAACKGVCYVPKCV